jgi:hypothetical protein
LIHRFSLPSPDVPNSYSLLLLNPLRYDRLQGSNSSVIHPGSPNSAPAIASAEEFIRAFGGGVEGRDEGEDVEGDLTKLDLS